MREMMPYEKMKNLSRRMHRLQVQTNPRLRVPQSRSCRAILNIVFLCAHQCSMKTRTFDEKIGTHRVCGPSKRRAGIYLSLANHSSPITTDNARDVLAY
jgi:hypothetical protein